MHICTHAHILIKDCACIRLASAVHFGAEPHARRLLGPEDRDQLLGAGAILLALLAQVSAAKASTHSPRDRSSGPH